MRPVLRSSHFLQDCGREIDQLCSFLGLSPSAEEKEKVKIGSKFDNMKQNKMANYSTVQVMNHKVSPFMRKGTLKQICSKPRITCSYQMTWTNLSSSQGKVGDWKNQFTVAQNEKLDEDYKQKMKNATLKFRTEV